MKLCFSYLYTGSVYKVWIMVQKIQNAKPKSKPDGDPQSYLPSHRFDAGALGHVSHSVSLDLVSPAAPAISPDLLS